MDHETTAYSRSAFVAARPRFGLQEEGRRSRWRRTQARREAPIVIGITADASGQYANSGDSDKRGILMAIEEWNAKGGRSRSADQVGRARHRDHPGHRLTRCRAPGQAREGRVLGRRDELGRRQRHFASGAEIRRHLPQHQLELALRVGRKLSPREVRVGRQRNQLQPGSGQIGDRQVWQTLAPHHQRLRLGSRHVERHQEIGDRRGRQHRGRALGAARDARFQLHPAQGAAEVARGHRRGGGRRRYQVDAGAGLADEARDQVCLDQQPARLARRLRAPENRYVRRLRYHLVPGARSSGREGLRGALPEGEPRCHDQDAGQCVLQRLLGRPFALRGHREGEDHQQPRGHQRARAGEDPRGRAHAAPRCVHESQDAPAAADDLPGHRQPGFDQPRRPLQDPEQHRSRSGHRQRIRRQVQARAIRATPVYEPLKSHAPSPHQRNRARRPLRPAWRWASCSSSGSWR